MNDDELLNQGGKVIERERAQTILLIEFLQEVERRKLHLKRGYPSLFEMLTKHFRYCAGSAQIRINSMRLVRDVPEVKEKLANGSISLTAAAQVQSFLGHEKRIEHIYSREQKLGLVEMCEGKSTREVERELASLNPDFGNRESVRAVSADRSRVTITMRNTLLEKLDRLKAHYAHSDPSMSYEDLVERLADAAIAKIDRAPQKRRALEQRVQEQRVQEQRVQESRDRLLDKSDLTKIDEVFPSNRESSVQELHAREVGERDEEKNEGVASVLNAVNAASTLSGVNAGKTIKPKSRYIPLAIKREVFFRECHRGCEYVDQNSGQRCGSKYFLQFDHRTPFSFGGKHIAENLRLLCGAHNRFVYGEFVRRWGQL